MHEDLTLQCPYCGELVELELEPDLWGSFVQDCEVCCRPWAITIARGDEGQPLVAVERAQ